VPIAGIAGDQQSALFGQMCVASWVKAKNTYGHWLFSSYKILGTNHTNHVSAKASVR